MLVILDLNWKAYVEKKVHPYEQKVIKLRSGKNWVVSSKCAVQIKVSQNSTKPNQTRAKPDQSQAKPKPMISKAHTWNFHTNMLKCLCESCLHHTNPPKNKQKQTRKHIIFPQSFPRNYARCSSNETLPMYIYIYICIYIYIYIYIYVHIVHF